MDGFAWGKRLNALWQKYRYAVLVVILGIVLMLLPEGKKESTVSEAQPTQALVREEGLQERLEGILSRIEGAGEVKLLLTQSAGERTVYEKDTDSSLGENSESHQSKTVILTTSNREEQALICQVFPETYLGAVVLCRGADSPAVRLAVMDAVSKATGLSTDRITVLKMK